MEILQKKDAEKILLNPSRRLDNPVLKALNVLEVGESLLFTDEEWVHKNRPASVISKYFYKTEKRFKCSTTVENSYLIERIL